MTTCLGPWEIASAAVGGLSAIAAILVFVLPEFVVSLAEVRLETTFFVRLAALLGILLNSFVFLAGLRGVRGDLVVLHAGIAKLAAPALMLGYWVSGFFPPLIFAVAVPDACGAVVLIVAWTRGRRPRSIG